jgi:hypothetical protein
MKRPDERVVAAITTRKAASFWSGSRARAPPRSDDGWSETTTKKRCTWAEFVERGERERCERRKGERRGFVRERRPSADWRRARDAWPS